MSTRTVFSILAFALLLSSGCGGGGGDEGRATLRGVVVDGNPYTRPQQLDSRCLDDEYDECSYRDPLPSPIADVEVIILRDTGEFYEDDAEVARVRTDAEGRFVVSVPPGSYAAWRNIGSAKRDAGYCVSAGRASLRNGDDKSVVVGDDLCANFVFFQY